MAWEGATVGLKFAEYSQVRFTHAPLASVLCQLRFKSPIYALATDIGVSGFQEAVRPFYPQTTAQSGAQIGLAGQQVNFQQTTWRFSSENNRWHVGLGVDFLSLETPFYTVFRDFYGRLEPILAVLERTVHPGVASRIGLRKVNEIRRTVEHPYDWREFVRTDLLGALAIDAFPAPVSFALSDIRFADGDNELVIRHGLHPTQEHTYVLDMDYYTEKELEIEPSLQMRDLFMTFSDGMTSFFHYMAQPRLIAEMEPVSLAGETDDRDSG
jgi:uncharacterized protein (TIGR04255 family)